MSDRECAKALLPTGPATKLDWFQVKTLYANMVDLYTIATRALDEVERLLEALKVIADGSIVRETHPLYSDYAEDGRYTWPERMSVVEQMAKAAITAHDASEEPT